MQKIHSTAIISDKAKIGKNVSIGAFSIIGENVIIGDNCQIGTNVLIFKNTTIGKNNRFFHSAVIGTDPQDLKYNGEETYLKIGDNNTFREFVTVNRSATIDEETTIGNNSLFMAYVHIAHNCHLGNNLVLANAVNLAGHINIGDFVSIGGMTAVHQFVKIGSYAFVGGKSGVKKDVPPFTRGEGMPYKVIGLNSVGLKRLGFSYQEINSIKAIYRIFYQSGLNFSDARKEAEKLPDLNKYQKLFIDFTKDTLRGLNK